MLSTLLALSAALLSTPTDAPFTSAVQSGVLREAWVGKLDLGPMQPVMQFRIVELESGLLTAYFDSVTEERLGLIATWSEAESQLVFVVDAIGLRFEGSLDADRTESVGTFDQGGRKLPLTLKRQSTEYASDYAWEDRPQRPRPPFPYTEVEVAFPGGAPDVQLAATLTLPEGPGPFPAAVLISGSGPQDRDETLLGHKPFVVIADHLARRGIAVLRYDDRGTAASTGTFEGATTADFAADAGAALAFLQTRSDIDARRLGLIGHSEGGLVAPLVAVERDDVALIVLLAAPGTTGEQVSLEQARAMAAAAGEDPADTDAREFVQRAVLGALRNAPTPDAAPDAIRAAVAAAIQELPEDQRQTAMENQTTLEAEIPRLTSPWMRFFLFHDPAEPLRRLTCPVLALWGTLDLQVLPASNRPPVQRALEEASNPDFETLLLPHLNHLFQQSKTGAVSEYRANPETFNLGALERISTWLEARFFSNAPAAARATD